MQYDPEKITFFAKTDARGQNVPFGIKAKDRAKHMYVIGKTGMGKSTLLENMAVQDIKNGEGIAFIDPHGATAEKLLEYVPPERIDDVLYFAPFDMDYPVSFNVMEDVGPDKRHLVVSGLMSTFKKIWVDAWSARMEYILSNTLLALLEYPDSTLLGVNRMLSDKAYREMVVANVSDPSVRSFWVDEFAKYNERYMQEAGDAIKNKIGQFTTNPLIRNIVGQPKSSFDVREIMDGKKILIMNLSKGLVGETNANLLGSMLITRIYLAAMSRANLSSMEIASAPNFYFYVDEFQSFANETFANILSEARKYKLNLTIAHQYIEQMEEEVRDAVFGNVGTTIAFRVGPLDAEFLETVFTPQFLATDLVNLGFAQIYLSLMIDGIGSRPFSAVTLPPIEQSHMSGRDQIIAASRRRYARTRAEVEDAIHEWHAPVVSRTAKPVPKSAPTVLKRNDATSGKTPVRASRASESTREIRVPVPPRPQVELSEQSSAPRRDEREYSKSEGTSVRSVSDTEKTKRREPNAPIKKNTEQDINSLRSVLRTIAGDDAGNQIERSAKVEKSLLSEKQQEHGTTPVRKEVVSPKDNKHSTDRRSRELKQQEKERKTSDTKSGDMKSALADALAQLKATSASPVDTVPKTVTPDTPPRVSKSSKGEKEVSKKTLERMLRITGNDNPPLRH